MSGSPKSPSFSFGNRKIKFSVFDIQEWNYEKCCIVKKAVLLKCRAVFFHEELLSKKVVILDIITSKFVPCLKLAELTESLIPLLPEVLSIFKDCCAYVTAIADESKVEGGGLYMEELKHGLMMLCCIMKSIIAICVCGRCLVPVLDWALHALEGAFEFSDEMKNGFSHDHLAHCFQLLSCDIQTLQKEVMKMLNQVLCQADFNVIPMRFRLICSRIQRLCQIVGKQNPKLHFALWDFYIKVSFHDDVLQQDFRCVETDRLSYLCSYVLMLMKDLTTCIEINEKNACLMKALEWQVLICDYHLKIIILICTKCGEFDDACVDCLFGFMSEFSRFSSLYYISKCSSENRPINIVQDEFAVTIECLMYHLLKKKRFMSYLLKPVIKELNQGSKISTCFLKLAAVCCIVKHGDLHVCTHSCVTYEAADIEECSCATTLCLICDVIDVLNSCDADVHLMYFTVAMCKDKTLRTVTLYEYMTVVSCAFASRCCLYHYKDVEKNLLRSLLGESDIFSCLICDVWYFFFRCGRSDLIFEYCYIFEKFIEKLPCNSFVWMNFLMNRLIKLVPHEQKKQLLLKYPLVVSKISEVNQEYLKDINNCLIYSPQTKPFMQNVLGHVPSVFISYCKRLKELDVLLFNYENDETKFAIIQHESAQCLLGCSRQLMFIANERILIQLLFFAGVMWNTHCDVIQVAVLSFVQAWQKQAIAPSLERDQVLRCLGKLYHAVLNHENYMIQHQAFYIFSEFVYQTSHKEVVGECLRTCASLKSSLSNFLSGIPNCGLHLEPKICMVLSHQNKWAKEKISARLLKKDKCHLLDCLRPVPNEHRQHEVQLYLNSLRDAAQRLVSFQQLPTWALESIKDTCNLMHRFVH